VVAPVVTAPAASPPGTRSAAVGSTMYGRPADTPPPPMILV
jgi:hypothetical protein